MSKVPAVAARAGVRTVRDVSDREWGRLVRPAVAEVEDGKLFDGSVHLQGGNQDALGPAGAAGDALTADVAYGREPLKHGHVGVDGASRVSPLPRGDQRAGVEHLRRGRRTPRCRVRGRGRIGECFGLARLGGDHQGVEVRVRETDVAVIRTGAAEQYDAHAEHQKSRDGPQTGSAGVRPPLCWLCVGHDGNQLRGDYDGGVHSLRGRRQLHAERRARGGRPSLRNYRERGVWSAPLEIGSLR